MLEQVIDETITILSTKEKDEETRKNEKLRLLEEIGAQKEYLN
jgi:hypothetical protein